MAYVQCRKVGAKAWRYLTSRDSLNRLRIHAARFESVAKAQALIDANRDDNPEWEWRVQEAGQ
jgi:hypothetical protein